MLHIIRREVLGLLRDRGSLFFIILFPSLMVFLLGNLLAQLDNADWEITPIRIAYTIEESADGSSGEAVASFLAALQGNARIELVEYTDSLASSSAVDNGEASASVHFKLPADIVIYQGTDSAHNRAVNTIFSGFARQTGAFQALAKAAPEKLAAASIEAGTSLISQRDFEYNRTMLDYYAVAMLVMILFMGGAIGGASMIYEGRKDGTLRRIMVSPKNRASLYIQTVAGAVPQSLTQVVVVMAFSTLLFGAHYADTLPLNLLLFFTFFIAGFAINTTFTFVGMFVSFNPTFIIMPILWALMFISGTFSKEIVIPGISEYSPIWQVQNAAFDLTVFGRTGKCWIIIAASLVLILIFTLLGSIVFSRKELSEL